MRDPRFEDSLRVVARVDLAARASPTPDQLRHRLSVLRNLFIGSELPGVGSESIVLPDESRPMWAGTTVPMLGLDFRPQASGLTVPVGSQVAPIDAMATYLTAEEVLGESISGGQLQHLVDVTPVRDLLAAVANLMVFLRDRGAIKRETHLELVDRFLNEPARTRCRTLVRDHYVFTAPQVLLAVAKLALLLDADDHGSPAADALKNAILCSFGVAGYLGAVDNSPDTIQWGDLPGPLAQELIANQHFNSSRDAASRIIRYRLLWGELPDRRDAALAAEHRAVFQDATGASLEDCFHTGMLLWSHSKANSTGVYPPRFLEGLGLSDSEKRAAELFIVDRSDAIDALHDEVERVGFDWSANTFRRHPLIRHPDGSLTLTDPEFLLDRACGSAAFLEINRALQEVPRKWGGYRDFRGHIVEDLVREQIKRMHPVLLGADPRVWTEDDMRRIWPDQKVCDLVVDCGWAWLCIEVVSRALSEDASTAGSIDRLDADIDRIVTDKAEQIDAVAKRLLKCDRSSLVEDVSGTRRIYPIVVAANGFPVGPITSAVIEARLEQRELLQHPRISRLNVVDLDNLEQVEYMHEVGGPSLLALVQEKARAGLRDGSLDQFMHLEKRLDLRRPASLQPYLDEAFSDLEQWGRRVQGAEGEIAA